MKVAFVTYDALNDVGGVSSWLRRLLPKLKAAGLELEVHVLGLDGVPGANCAWFTNQGIVHRFRPAKFNTRKSVRDCLQMLEQSQPDVYVPNCILPAYFAAGYVRKQGVETIGVIHSDDPFYWGIVDEFVNGRPEFRLSAVVAVSQFLEEAIRSEDKNHDTQVRRIGYGVPLSQDPAMPPVGNFRLIYAGRLVEEQKCISEVTRALCSLVKQSPKVEAWIVGEGDARTAVEEIIRTSGADPVRVKLLGRVDVSNVYSVLRDCHGFVLLSDYEGLPVAMLEAMAIGVVPICLDMRSGIREAIQHGFNGLIVKDRHDDFRAAVHSLQDDVALWMQLSANARATAVEQFSEERCGALWCELLRSFSARDQAVRLKIPSLFTLPGRNSKFGDFDSRPLPLGSITRRLQSGAKHLVRTMLRLKVHGHPVQRL